MITFHEVNFIHTKFRIVKVYQLLQTLPVTSASVEKSLYGLVGKFFQILIFDYCNCFAEEIMVSCHGFLKNFQLYF